MGRISETSKRPGRDESTCVLTYLCMEAMLGISLHCYPYLTKAKMLYLSYYCLCLLFNKTREKGRTGSTWKGEVLVDREGAGGRVEK
jgi:hypothetical protein